MFEKLALLLVVAVCIQPGENEIAMVVFRPYYKYIDLYTAWRINNKQAVIRLTYPQKDLSVLGRGKPETCLKSKYKAGRFLADVTSNQARRKKIRSCNEATILPKQLRFQVVLKTTQPRIRLYFQVVNLKNKPLQRPVSVHKS